MIGTLSLIVRRTDPFAESQTDRVQSIEQQIITSFEIDHSRSTTGPP